MFNFDITNIIKASAEMLAHLFDSVYPPKRLALFAGLPFVPGSNSLGQASAIRTCEEKPWDAYATRAPISTWQSIHQYNRSKSW